MKKKCIKNVLIYCFKERLLFNEKKEKKFLQEKKEKKNLKMIRIKTYSRLTLIVCCVFILIITVFSFFSFIIFRNKPSVKRRIKR